MKESTRAVINEMVAKKEHDKHNGPIQLTSDQLWKYSGQIEKINPDYYKYEKEVKKLKRYKQKYGFVKK
jgi:hypothetical protein